ncbi:MAG: T9SS type A sorting domain-containing protein [Bacteroidota bacterium]
MKKRKILIYILALCLQSAIGQNWVRVYGDGLNALGRYVTNDYDKGFLILGDLDYRYSWIIKADVNGEILWDKKIGNGTGTVWSGNIEKTIDNGIIICGTSTKFSGSFDAYLIKLNACGEIEWCKVLETPDNYDMGLKVKQTQEGDYVLLSYFENTNPYSRTSLFKFNSSGDLLWHQFYPLDSIYYQDEPYDLVIDNDGYLIITDRYFPDPGTSGPDIVRHHFTKTDTAGIIQWDLVYGANNFYYGGPWAVKKSKSGYYYEAGNHIFSNGTARPAFVKVRHNGIESYYADILSGTYWGGLSSIDFLQDSMLVMVGGWYSDLNTGHDVFFKSDTLGNLRKVKELPKLDAGYWAACKTLDDKFVAIGNDAPNGSLRIVAVKVNSDLEYDSTYNQPFTYDSLCPHPIASDTIDPDCENEYVDIDEPFSNPETTKLKVFPNPANDKITLEMPKYLVLSNTTSKIPSTTIYHLWKSVKLEIYDITGKKVMEREINKSDTILDLDVSEWGKGMYAFRLVYQKQEVGNAKVVVQ